MKNQQILGYFDVPCDRCDGTGQYRHFGDCFACKGQGKGIGAVVAQGLAGEFPYIALRAVSVKTGRLLKQHLQMPATRLTERKRYDVQWTNSGKWFKHMNTDKPGAPIGVQGLVAGHVVTNAADEIEFDTTGEFSYDVALTGGGYSIEPVTAVDFKLEVRETI